MNALLLRVLLIAVGFLCVMWFAIAHGVQSPEQLQMAVNELWHRVQPHIVPLIALLTLIVLGWRTLFRP